MMHSYRSKIDIWLLLLLASISLFLLYQLYDFMLLTASGLSRVLMLGLYISIFYCLWLPLCNTRYQLHEDHLSIRSMWFSWRIELNQIQRIQPCVSFISAPALSVQRLEIIYNVHGFHESIFISPHQLTAFHIALQQKIAAQHTSG